MPRNVPKDPASAERREKGSGSAPKWNAAKQRWQVNITLGGQRKTLTHKTSQRELELARDRELAAALAGEPSPADKRLLGDFLDRWIESVRVASLHGKPKRQTYRSYEGHVRVHLKPGLGDEPLVRLSVDRVQQFFDDKLAEGHSPANMSRVRATLRIALGRAERQKLVSRNVAKLVEISVPDNDRVGKALDGEQVQALLAAGASERHGPMLAFLVATGLRLGEARALRWRDVDEQREQLRVRHTLEQLPGEPWALVAPKSRPSKDRVVPLVPLALQVLQQQRDRQKFEQGRARDAWVEQGFVFANEVGDVVGQHGVEDAMKRSLTRAGLESDYRVHDLRHSACTYLLGIGIPVTTVQAIMGHATLTMTQRYAHLQAAMLDDAKARMSAWFATFAAPAASAR